MLPVRSSNLRGDEGTAVAGSESAGVRNQSADDNLTARQLRV